MTAITKTIRARPTEVKTWKSRLSADGPEVTQIRVKISSTTEDRDGDEFSLAGLESMIPALKSGKVPFYLDHGLNECGVTRYGALDMIGGWIDGEIVGNALYATAFIEPGNQDGERLARKIAAGSPIGFSVGFGVIESRPKPGGHGLIFDAVSLWEVSAVGIPSNPDAVSHPDAVITALKSIRASAGLEPVKTTISPEDRRLILIRMADGTRGYVTAATFRKIIGEVVEEAIAPLQERINTLAAAAKAARPVTVKSGINRGRMKRGIVVAPYKGGIV